MTILVQNCLTHHYLKNVSEWTPDASPAMSFATGEKAMAFCMEHRIREVQVVLRFGHERYDVQVPITPECEDTAPSQNTLRG